MEIYGQVAERLSAVNTSNEYNSSKCSVLLYLYPNVLGTRQLCSFDARYRVISRYWVIKSEDCGLECISPNLLYDRGCL